MNKFLGVFIAFIICFSTYCEAKQGFPKNIVPKWDQLTFDYPKDTLETIKKMPKPETQITNKDLSHLLKETNLLTKTTELSGIDLNTLPPYLANAQKDFAWLSFLLTGEFVGDLGPVTLWTLQLFIPDAKLPTVEAHCFDVYSSSLAALVVERAANRLFAERKQVKNYPIKKGNSLWTPTSPGYRGIDYGTMQTWFLTNSQEFVADVPSDKNEFWQKQAAVIKEEQRQLDAKKTNAVFEWAGMTSLNAGSWESIVDEYIAEKNLPVASRLYIRALFLSGIADSTAAAFNSKYIYWIQRPSQKDDAVKPLIPIPNHPSYPSAHSTNSYTAVVLLQQIFPEDSAKWNELAEEAGWSRIWGGIHYPTDHEAGKKLGEEVGETVLKRMPQVDSNSNINR